MPLIFFSLFMALSGTIVLALSGAAMVDLLVGYFLIGTCSLFFAVLAITAPDIFQSPRSVVPD